MIFTNKSKRAISLALSFLVCFTLALPAYAKSTIQTDNLNLDKSISIKSSEFESSISSRRMGIVRIFVNAEDNVTKGFKFVIEGNGIKKEHITGDDGAIYFTEIPVGVYTIRQLEIDDRYVETLKKEVSVESNQTTNIIFENLPKRSNVIGNIIDNSGNNIGGATVSLYKKTNLIKPIDTKISLSNGSFEFSNIQYGDYIIKTSGTSNNFSHSDKEIQVRKNGGYTDIGDISAKNIMGKIIGKNVSLDNESLGISGGVIGLYKYIDSSKKRSVHISSVTVDINGNFSFNNISEGDYYLRDLAPGQGYDTIFRDYDFKIDKPNQIIEMILKSKPLVDDISIGKNKLNQEDKNALTIDENISGINFISDEIADVENQSLDVINLKQEEINPNNLIDNNNLKNLSTIELGYKNNINIPKNNKLGIGLIIFLISITSTGLGIVFIKKHFNKYKFKK